MSFNQSRPSVFVKSFCACLVISNAARVAFNASDIGQDKDGKGVIVIDVGSYMIKAGVLAEEYEDKKSPEKMRSTVQTSKHPDMMTKEYKFQVGGSESSVWTMKYPIVKGQPENWDQWQKLMQKMFAELDANWDDVIMTFSSSGASKSTIEKLTQELFETFQIGRLLIVDQAVLSTMSPHEETGGAKLVVNIGEDETYAVLSYEGVSIPHTRKATPLGSKFVTDCFNSRLFYSSKSQADLLVSRQVKESVHTFVALDYDAAKQDFAEPSYEKPDGTTMKLGAETFQCPEQLFDPVEFKVEIGNRGQGIVDMTYDAIQEIDIDVQREAIENLVITGGGANMKGFSERFVKDLKAKFRYSLDIKTIKPQVPRDQMAWNGGAFIASLGVERLDWFTKAAYEDDEGQGAAGILNKLK